MRPLPANAELDLERYSSLAAKEFASRQSVDTQKALVAQYQAAIQRDEAAIDNAACRSATQRSLRRSMAERVCVWST
jgi:multidrug resistance efflux pump